MVADLVAEKDKVEIFRKYEGAVLSKKMVLNLKNFEAELKGRAFVGRDVIDEITEGSLHWINLGDYLKFIQSSLVGHKTAKVGEPDFGNLFVHSDLIEYRTF